MIDVQRSTSILKSKDELLSDFFQRAAAQVHASFGRLARTYLQQICADMWCCLEDLPGVGDDRDTWRQRQREREREREKESGKSVLAAHDNEDIDTRLTKAWTAIDRLTIIWKSDLTDKMKRSFLQAAVVSILLYGCTTWTLTKRLKKKLDGNYIRMLRAILNKSWRQHPTRQQLYGHQPPITKTIQVRRSRHCWRSKEELIGDVLQWNPAYGRAKAGRPAGTYIQQLCEDTGCSPEDQPEATKDREKWRERVRDIRASGTTWYIYIYIYSINNIYDFDCNRAENLHFFLLTTVVTF